jgi:predicted metal-dependent hydrolase
MYKQIVFRGEAIPYLLRKSRRARRMRLAVYLDGRVVVTAPHYAPQYVMEAFIREKSPWLFKKIASFKEIPREPWARDTHKDYLLQKKSAYALVMERITHWNTLYQFSFADVRIKNQKTRWGSCSRKRNLNFNYKIKYLPLALLDLIVVHELCHLEEMNHSGRFWALVARTIPHYLSLRKELKAKGISFG